MRLLILTRLPRNPNATGVFARLLTRFAGDMLVLDKKQSENLSRSIKTVNIDLYSHVLIDIPFKFLYKQADFVKQLPRVLIFEEDSYQNYLKSSKWYGLYSDFYKKIPGVPIVVTGRYAARRLCSEGFNAIFVPKGFDERYLYRCNEQRGIELGFIGRIENDVYAGRRAILEALQSKGLLQVLRTKPGDEYRETLNKIQVFVSADVGLNEYMAKNFEAMACGCALLAWRQGEEEEAMGLKDGEHLLLYSSIDELLAKIEYLRKFPEVIEKIAEAGNAYVTENFCQRKVAEHIAEQLTIQGLA